MRLLGDGAEWAQSPHSGQLGPPGHPVSRDHSPFGLSQTLFLPGTVVPVAQGPSAGAPGGGPRRAPVCPPAAVPLLRDHPPGLLWLRPTWSCGPCTVSSFLRAPRVPAPAASSLAAGEGGGASWQVPGHQTVRHTAPLGGHTSSWACLPPLGGPGPMSCSVRNPRGLGSRGATQSSVGPTGVRAQEESGEASAQICLHPGPQVHGRLAPRADPARVTLWPASVSNLPQPRSHRKGVPSSQGMAALGLDSSRNMEKREFGGRPSAGSPRAPPQSRVRPTVPLGAFPRCPQDAERAAGGLGGHP